MFEAMTLLCTCDVVQLIHVALTVISVVINIVYIHVHVHV